VNSSCKLEQRRVFVEDRGDLIVLHYDTSPPGMFRETRVGE
jgi:hypothetical protein